MRGLVPGAGRTVRGGQHVEEGVGREELVKDVAEAFGQPSVAFAPCLLSKCLGDFKVGSGVAEATILFVLHFLPLPDVAGHSRFSARVIQVRVIIPYTTMWTALGYVWTRVKIVFVRHQERR